VPRLWLNEHIHKYGCLYTPSELIKHATGKSFDPADLINYLNNKFNSVYGKYLTCRSRERGNLVPTNEILSILFETYIK
jgi:hypothetical protein